MVTKAIIFDCDGMIIATEMFSTHLSKKYKIPLEQILEFFENEFLLCLIAKADLKKELKKYLKKWSVNKSAEEILAWWFKLEDKVDNRIIKVVKKLKNKGIKCYLATNQEKYRTDYIIKNMVLGKIFDNIFSSSLIGFRKPEKKFYLYIYNSIRKDIKNIKKSEILYWDDKKENIKAAKEFGFRAELYENFLKFQKKIKCFADAD